ncbi:MAG: ABC transporter substrate-binding protein, partial [Planctomycetota bacterium]
MTTSARTVCLFVSVLWLTGCGSQESPDASLRFASVDTAEIQHVSSSGPQEVTQTAFNQQPSSSDFVIIGLDADMTSGSAASGEAIRRGVVLAIEEINREGGVLGRKVELVVRDHRGNPDRGVDNIREFSMMPNLLAVVGGIHTPVALQELKTIHEERVLYLGPWAAGTGVVANGYTPNFVYRVSVRDEYAGGFLVDQSLERGFTRIGLLLERTGWGRSNLKAMTAALKSKQLDPACVEWVNWGERDISLQINNLRKAESEVVLLVCNPLEGVNCIKTMANLSENERLPIISHWGISAGSFFELANSSLDK